MIRSKRKAVPALAALALTAAACGGGGGGGGGGGSSAPGITKDKILIGSHYPLTGPAAPGYSEIGPAADAYFKYVNAHGGIYGRKIEFKYLDDAYDPSKTSSVVRQLVLKDNVFAIYNGLGTPTHSAVVDFLNAQKVPDLFVASGCLCWDKPKEHPWTFGWQIDYVREGKILGKYVKEHFAGKKVAYFYQNDEFGKDGVKGLDYEIPKDMVVARQSYQPGNTNIGPQVSALRSSGADVVVSFTIPAFTALLRLNSLKIGYKPKLVVSNVGSDPITLSGLLEQFAKKSGEKVSGSSLIEGMVTDGYLPSLGEESNDWIKLFKKVHDKYDPKAPFDGNVLYGEASAYAFVQSMMKAGKNPTREDVVKAVESGLPQGPVVAPYAFSDSDHSGMTGAYIGVINGGEIVRKGPVYVTDTSPSGPVKAYEGGAQQPPPNGIPSP
ncbi:MAG: ABC transporter substrate-binding protein [Streptosporangiaceae bacterium]